MLQGFVIGRLQGCRDVYMKRKYQQVIKEPSDLARCRVHGEVAGWWVGSFQFVFRAIFHLILHYWANDSLFPEP